MEKNVKVTIFTDGSSRGNPGPGGWGAIVITESKHVSDKSVIAHGGDTIMELGSGEKFTTNNRMELSAALNGISHTREGSSILLHTDSSYVINGITKWIHGWKKNGWVTKAKGDVLNKDLWIELDALSSGRKIEWKYVGGHIGILGNERCDHIATAFADGRKIELYDGPLGGYDLPNILDISHDEILAKKKSSSSHSSASRSSKAFSYVSVIGGVIEVLHSWNERPSSR